MTRLSPPPWAPKRLARAVQTQRSTTFPRRIRSHADWWSRFIRVKAALSKAAYDVLTLKVLSESRVTWATSVPVLVRPLCSRVTPDVRDRQTSDIRQKHRLMSPGAVHNNTPASIFRNYQRDINYRWGLTFCTSSDMKIFWQTSVRIGTNLWIPVGTVHSLQSYVRYKHVIIFCIDHKIFVSLLTRLESLDNFCKTGQDCTAVNYNMEVPQPSSYTDVHLGHKISFLSFSRITDYYSSCGELFKE